MPESVVSTVPQFLKELPPERRAVVSAVRNTILKSLPKGYREVVRSRMISYEIPLETYPDTYNGQPLAYAALAAQKSYYALYLMGAYVDPSQVQQLEDGFKKAGKKLDMGKSCVRFQSLEDLPLNVIGKVIASMPPKAFIARHEAALKRPAKNAQGRGA